jgi:hypothetical protein
VLENVHQLSLVILDNFWNYFFFVLPSLDVLKMKAVTFVGFLTGFVLVLCIGNYYRAKRAMEHQRQRRLAKLAGRVGNGIVGDPGIHGKHLDPKEYSSPSGSYGTNNSSEDIHDERASLLTVKRTPDQSFPNENSAPTRGINLGMNRRSTYAPPSLRTDDIAIQLESDR